MALTVEKLLAFNVRRAAPSGPFKAIDWPSQIGSHPPHVWHMPAGYYIPICRHCNLSTLEAQLANPTTFGEGPCPKRSK